MYRITLSWSKSFNYLFSHALIEHICTFVDLCPKLTYFPCLLCLPQGCERLSLRMNPFVVWSLRGSFYSLLSSMHSVCQCHSWSPQRFCSLFFLLVLCGTHPPPLNCSESRLRQLKDHELLKFKDRPPCLALQEHSLILQKAWMCIPEDSLMIWSCARQVILCFSFSPSLYSLSQHSHL
jgi:hypothetical protein